MIGELRRRDGERSPAQLREDQRHRRQVAEIDRAAVQARILGDAARNLQADEILPQDEVAEEFERARLDDRPELDPAPGQGVLDVMADGERVVGQGQGMAEAVAQPDRPGLRRQRMPRAHQRAEGLVSGEERMQLRRRRRLQDQGEIGLERRQGRHGLRVIANLDHEADLGEPGPVGLDLLGHHLRDEGLAAGERHVTAAHPRKIGDLRPHPVEIRHLVADVPREELAGRVEPHPLRQALEDRRAELVFEILDLPRQGRGRQVQPLRGAPDRAGTCDLGDVGDGAQVLHAGIVRPRCRESNDTLKK